MVGGNSDSRPIFLPTILEWTLHYCVICLFFCHLTEADIIHMRIKKLLICIGITLCTIAATLGLYSPNVQHSSVPSQTLLQRDMATDALDTKRSKGKINAQPHNPESFYQFIIDTNLFRPLGWRTPKKQPDWTLIGTAVSENIEESEAFILERSSNRMHIVKVGDVFGEALVKVIESKRVILNEAGKEIVLYCGRLQFIRTN